jgi:hypothetical protein
MFVVDKEKDNAIVAQESLSEFDKLSRVEQNRMRYESYNSALNFVDSILNVDIDGNNPEEVLENIINKNDLNSEEDIQDFVVKMVTSGVPNSLIEEMLDEDEDVSVGALEQIREYIADSFLDDFEPMEIVDSIHMVDWLTLEGSCSKWGKSRVGDDGKPNKCTDRTTEDGTAVAVYDDGGGDASKSSADNAHKRGKSSSKRVRGSASAEKYKKTIKNSTKKAKEDMGDSFIEDGENEEFDMYDSFMIHLADSAKTKEDCKGKCGRLKSWEECVSVYDPKKRKLVCEKRRKVGNVTGLDKKKSRAKKGHKISRSTLLKMARSRAKGKELRDK